ncbi:MAG: flagellar hook-length control protein FliK [Gammaproteobacteria bacterium]|nr:flagellar hook-length control protein FliK [Gammaproteobacteria bacterium]
MVVANPQPGVADLRIGSLLVKAQTGGLPLSPGQTLRLEVASLKEMPVLKLLGLMQQNPLQQALRDVLPRQQPLPLLFTALARLATPTPMPTAQRTPNLSPEIVRLAQELLAKLPDTARASTGDGLRQAIRDSGLFLESKLAPSTSSTAQAQTPTTKPAELASDFKANLLRLVQAIRDNAANSAPAAARANPLSSAGLSAGAPATSALPTPPLPTALTTALAAATVAARLPASAAIGPGTLDPGAPLQRGLPPLPPVPLAQLVKGQELAFSLNELQRFAEGALARVQLHQLSSLPQERAPLPEWLIELPIRRDNETDIWSLRIGRDAERERDAPVDADPVWSVMLAFDLPGIGPMQSRITLRGDRVTAQFFSRTQGVLPLVAEHLPLLQARLQQAGLRVEELTCHHGEIPKPKPPPQTRILDEHA